MIQCALVLALKFVFLMACENLGQSRWPLDFYVLKERQLFAGLECGPTFTREQTTVDVFKLSEQEDSFVPFADCEVQGIVDNDKRWDEPEEEENISSSIILVGFS